MIRSSALRKTTIDDLVPGDMFRFSYGSGAVLALFLERVENKSPRVGILRGPDFKNNMIWLDYNGGPRECLSYGSEWLLEEEHGSETYCGERQSRGNARLYIDSPGLVMVFGPSNGNSFGFNFVIDLQSNTSFSLTSDAAPILRWKIWENEDHRDSGNAPLFDTENP